MLKKEWKGLLILVLLTLVFFWIIKATLVSSYISSKLRVPVSISRISTWPSQTTLKNFRVKNPRGFETRTAFEAKEVKIDYDWKKLTQNPVEIAEVFLENVFLGIEFSNPLGTKNNWTEIAGNMGKERSEKEVIVHKLILSDVTIEVRGLGLKMASQTKKIGRIELNEIDSQKGFPTQELISQIFEGAGLQQYIQDAFTPENVIDKFLNPFGS